MPEIEWPPPSYNGVQACSMKHAQTISCSRAAKWSKGNFMVTSERRVFVRFDGNAQEQTAEDVRSFYSILRSSISR